MTNAKDEMLWMSGNEAVALGAFFAGARALAT
ncbi:pyruvate/2-oxoacid:ferredoxin oxidoreductase alpha subunit [Desulfoprunum benzoelyticum]|uniref:Pyruvate/2-oxoacid:ferredoxin oxidoreductase alpha subunit n=1 Tax=Desulfoprunum benzoelyticum TaxID=1506996 RepID=A0A840UUM5_9BACT|nr:pyruvate/2-oxoacid:ferredoxin oxidoreductase alpha subunit [Desulfoprunum benzoelyticum]